VRQSPRPEPFHPDLAGHRRTGVRALAAVSVLAGTSVLVAPTILASPTAGAATTGAPSTCRPVVAGGSSGWCPLTPGHATGNVRALGGVSLDSSAQVLAVRTVGVPTGATPATTFACLVPLPASQVAHRLQETQCRQEGGVWFAVSGGALSVDLSGLALASDTTFTVQVAAGPSAGDANGDAFYADVTVSTTTNVPPLGGGSLF
jgi:hypothetical protein